VSQQINLFNPKLQRQKKLFSAVAMLQALLLIGIGGTALAAFMSYRVAGTEKLAEAGREQVALREARLAKVARDFAPRKRDAALAQEVADAEASLRILQDAKEMLLHGDFGNAVGYSVYLRGLARQSVAGVWLTKLTISGNDMGIEGRSVRADLVPHYISRLAGESAFEGKSFGGLDITHADEVATGATAAAPPATSAATSAAVTPGVFTFKLQAAGPLTQAARSTK
jgi:Tfp pilus assembly protein PilN